MKRTLLVFGIVMAGFQYLSAQQVTKTTVEIDKTPQAAQTVSFPEQEEVVKDAIENIIRKSDGKVRRSKGYILGKNVRMSELSDQKLNVYFKLDAEGRKKNQTSIVTMAIQQPDGKYASDSSNTELQQRGNVFLTGFQQRVLVYKKDTQIAELQEELKKLNKDLASDKKDNQKALDKKMKKMKEIESRLSTLTGN
jgi:hypothetical protein